jgi:hypothetical protein
VPRRIFSREADLQEEPLEAPGVGQISREPEEKLSKALEKRGKSDGALRSEEVDEQQGEMRLLHGPEKRRKASGKGPRLQ